MNNQSKQSIQSTIASFSTIATDELIHELADPTIERCFSNLLDHIHADAAAIWLKQSSDDGDVLTIAYNVGGRGSDIEGVVRQPLDRGLVSKAFRERKTICHQGIFKHKEQSAEVDLKLGQFTAHQIAVPFDLFGKPLGALTAIQTLDAGIKHDSDWGFKAEDIKHFETWLEIIQRLFELNYLRSVIR
jgi:hypothetical protein